MKSDIAPPCSPLERVKLAAQLLTKVREIGATPAGALHGAVDSMAVIRRAKLASEVNTLMSVVHAQPSAVRTLSGGYVVSSYRLDEIEAMPAAESVGAVGKGRWHAPVTMPDGRIAWTNGTVMLMGNASPYPVMTVCTLVKMGATRQASAAIISAVFASAKRNATYIVQGVYAVRVRDGGEFVAMVSGEDVVTVKRAHMAMAQNWCGQGYRVAMGDDNDRIYIKSVDGNKEVVIAPIKMSYTADQMRGGGEAVTAASPAAKKQTIAPVIKA